METRPGRGGMIPPSLRLSMLVSRRVKTQARQGARQRARKGHGAYLMRSWLSYIHIASRTKS